MTTKMQKWGNSLGVRIPKEIVKKAKLRDGKKVLVRNVGKTIVITSYEKKETLEDLVSQITPENRYDELYWGPAVGKEIW